MREDQESPLSGRTQRYYEKQFRKLEKAKMKESLRYAKNEKRSLRTRKTKTFVLPVLIISLLLGGQYWLNEKTPQYEVAQGASRPTTNVNAQSSPLGNVDLPQESGDYEFLMTQKSDDSPVSWDPCRPIKIVTSGNPPEGSAPLVEQALANLASASGYALSIEGTTDEAPPADRESFQPNMYGDRWAPLLLSWSDPEETPDLGGSVAGLGGGQPEFDTNGKLYYVTGAVTLDAPQLAEALAYGDVEGTRAVIEHEFAHALGLDHVSDPTSLMFAETTQTSLHLNAGDRMGLALLGQNACATEL